MEGLRTEYEFVLPRGYVDLGGNVHKRGTMRLATARDELEPLRDPTISGPDDPRLTLLVLARVIRALGDLPIVTIAEMEGLFAADLAYLQDFYGVINFGTDDDIEALLAAQAAADLPSPASTPAAAAPVPAAPAAADNGTSAPRPTPAAGRRAAIEEVPSGERRPGTPPRPCGRRSSTSPTTSTGTWTRCSTWNTTIGPGSCRASPPSTPGRGTRRGSCERR